MKIFFILSLLLNIHFSFSQFATMSIEPKSLILYDLNSTPNQISILATWSEELYVLKVQIKIPSEKQIGKFDEVSLTTRGKDVFKPEFDLKIAVRKQING